MNVPLPLFPLIQRLSCLVVCLAMASGCSSWNIRKSLPWPLGEEKAGKPDKVVAVWTDTVLYQANQTPERGFGGRLMFYEGKKETPVKAEGSIVVYAFDETNRDAGNAKPDRKYIFTPEQLAARYSKSKIGHSYSIWIPWDAVGGVQKDISLIVRLEPKNGGAVVIGKPSRQLLPGEKTPGKDGPQLAVAGAATQIPAVPPAAAPVQQASYNAPALQPCGSTDSQPPQRRMTTVTIPMPAEMAAGGATALGPSTATSQAPATATPGAATASAPPTMSLAPRSHFSPPRSRVLGGSIAQLVRDRGPSSSYPGESQCAPGSAPGLQTTPGSSATGQPAQQPTR